MIFGGLIVLFLAIEPRGLARLWRSARKNCASGHFHIDRPDRATAPKETPMRTTMQNWIGWIATAACACGLATTAAAEDAKAAAEQFIPLLVYRTGPYAPNGTPWANAKQDYIKLINARDGGVNGVS